VTKLGGKFHLKLNMGERPIANKYCEGKMQRTLKRELKVRELASREAMKINVVYVQLSGFFWESAFWSCACQHGLFVRQKLVSPCESLC
jgi:hypothetical protein